VVICGERELLGRPKQLSLTISEEESVEDSG